jgi:hypothetical protein
MACYRDSFTLTFIVVKRKIRVPLEIHPALSHSHTELSKPQFIGKFALFLNADMLNKY